MLSIFFHRKRVVPENHLVDMLLKKYAENYANDISGRITSPATGGRLNMVIGSEKAGLIQSFPGGKTKQGAVP